MSRTRIMFSSFLVLSLIAIIGIPYLSIAQTTMQPLLGQVTTPIGDVMETGTVKVPVITWGGDYEPVHANGDSKFTTSTSIWGRFGLNIQLVREDDFRGVQLSDYLSGRSPYLRGTLDMINLVTEVTTDPRVKPVVVVLMTRSTGGDVAVVMPNVKTVGDFKGKRVAVQAYGPHLYFLWSLLASNNMKLSDVTLVFMPDLQGDNSPAGALLKGKADVAFVISPDAAALTSGNTVGTGSEGSVKGARVLLSTKSASKIIYDVYAVRSDYFASHHDEVMKFAAGILKSQEELARIFSEKTSAPAPFQKIRSAFHDIVMGRELTLDDAEAMFGDMTMCGFSPNEKFFTDKNDPRGFDKVNAEIQTAFKAYGILRKGGTLAHAVWDYAAVKAAGSLVAKAEAPVFNAAQVAAVVTAKAQKGTLAEGQIFPTFSIYFTPEQKQFPPEQYAEAFSRVVSDASKYGGAVIVIEGNSDPLGYLKAKKAGTPGVELNKIRQAGLNLSVSRAIEVRDAIIAYAKGKGVSLDPTQFSIVGNGFRTPKSGMRASGACSSATWLSSDDPCPPKDEAAWKENMRVDFRIISVEAEAVKFEAL